MFKELLKWLGAYYLVLLGAGIMLCMTSCGMSQLTIQQQRDLIKIDRELSELWNDYEYASDSLWIERDKILKSNKIKK
tara:strand:+ start:1573 stop:1806 length:234 start_codon:yes stop_codon:yes gene_type:complete